MRKIRERNNVIHLRLDGKSISEISKILDIRWATVSKWCKEIFLTENQKKRIEETVKKNSLKKLTIYYEQKRQIKEKLVNQISTQAHKDIGTLTKRELFLMGTALYWAEGFKSKAEHRLGFCNSDPTMILFYLNWLKKCLNVNRKNITLRITLNAEYRNRAEEIQEYWSKFTKIPKDQFTRSFFQNVKWKRIYNNEKQYYGVLRIHAKQSRDLLWKTLAEIAAIKKQIV